MSERRLRIDIRQLQTPLIIVLGAWAVAALVFHFVFTRPRVVEFASLADGTGTKQRELLERKKLVEEREAYLELLQRARTDLTVLRSDVLSTRDARMVEVELEIEALCNQFNINLDRVSLDHEVLEAEELDRMEQVVPLEGGYANLRRFLHAVEESDDFLIVERVALAEGQEGGVMLELSITLTTYFDLTEAEKQRLRQQAGPRRRAAAGST